MNTAVGISYLVTVAVLEGVTGLPGDERTNENQTEENNKFSLLQNEDLERLQKGALDKIGCRIFEGNCQKIGDFCDGEVKTGAIWCRRPEIFGCCISAPFEPEKFDCALDGKVYPHWRSTEDRCIILLCLNGTWVYGGRNYELCGSCSATSKTIIETYVPHNISGSLTSNYNITQYDGTYVFSQYGRASAAQLGIDISLEFTNEFRDETFITDVFYSEPGITVEIFQENNYSTILVNGNEYIFNGNEYIFEGFSKAFPIYATFGTVFIIFTYGTWPYYGGFYIAGSQGLSVKLDYYYDHAYEVYAFATQALHNELYGLCDVFTVVPPYPEHYTMKEGAATEDITEFIQSWEFPFPNGRRTLLNKMAKQDMEK